MGDPVEDKSGFLCTYMSSHPDTLVAYAKHFGKVDGHVLSAKMLSINSKVVARTLCTVPQDDGDAFPFAGYEPEIQYQRLAE